MTAALIALGSNEGNREAYLARAVQRLRAHRQLTLQKVSSWHATRPAGGPSSAEYLNGAATLQTSLSAEELLGELQRIEAELGRLRDVRWGSRSIDLDLLLYADAETTTRSLSVPHPRLSFRRFVLAPACEIAADWIHPVNGATLAQLLARLESTPPRIAIVGIANVEPLQSTIRRLQPAWEVLSDWSADESYRLVFVTEGDAVTPAELQQYDRRRRESGAPPVMWLPRVSEGWLLQEVLAAITAME